MGNELGTIRPAGFPWAISRAYIILAGFGADMRTYAYPRGVLNGCVTGIHKSLVESALGLALAVWTKVSMANCNLEVRISQCGITKF